MPELVIEPVGLTLPPEKVMPPVEFAWIARLAVPVTPPLMVKRLALALDQVWLAPRMTGALMVAGPAPLCIMMPFGAVLRPPLPVVVAALMVRVEALPPVPEAIVTVPEPAKVRLLIDVAASRVVLRLAAVGLVVEKTTSVADPGAALTAVPLVADVLKLDVVAQLELVAPLQ